LSNESTTWFGSASELSTATELLLFLVIVLVLLIGLAIIGLLTVASLGEAERQRRAREVERGTVDTGHQSHRTAGKAHGEFRPWEF
jgi:hypothetical protein